MRKIEDAVKDRGTLKILAEYAKAFNQKWFGEESKALDSVPTFSAEQFIASASPDAVLALIAEIDRHQELYDHMKAMRKAYGYESWTEVLTIAEKLKAENEKLRADNSSKNGQLKAFGKQVSTLGRTIRNRDRRLAKLEPKS